MGGCGDAFDGVVAGLAVGGDLVVTVAHAVIQADLLVVRAHGDEGNGVVVALDRRTDLALLEVGGLDSAPAELGEARIDDRVTLVGGLAAGDIPATVRRVLDIRIEEVLGTDRVIRRGLELSAEAEVGDSGSGVFGSGGELLGVVFAVDSDGSGTAWATAASELTRLLEAPRTGWVCDPARSRLVERQ